MESIDLRTEKDTDQIALRGIRIRATVAALSVKACVEQAFVNMESRAIEAIYTFPVPDGAAVCGFEVITGDHILTGHVEETDTALSRYDDAVAQGHGAFALEADRPDVFTIRVGNLKPRQSATIRVSYVAPLVRVDRAVRIAFPTTVAPRYATTSGTDPLDAAIDSDALNPPRLHQVPYGLSLEVNVDLTQRVRAITSPTHPLDTQSGDRGGYVVRLGGGQTMPDRDIVLTIELEKDHGPSAELVRSADGEQFIAVSFVPEFSDEELADPPSTETVFVQDCSGSMAGESTYQATLALALCLRSMNAGDRFNICRFGSTFEMMSPEPLVYSAATLERALDFIRQVANLGGTELMNPLTAILETATAVPVRNIVLLTDGQLTNEQAVIELAAQHRSRNRIFSFGVGSACSSYLVNGLAQATGGAAEFISGRERIEEKVLRTFSRISSPLLSDVRVDWAGVEVQTLSALPPVFDGDLMTVFGRVKGVGVPTKVTLAGKLSGRPVRWEVAVPEAHEDHDGLIRTLWARQAIQQLEEGAGNRRTARAKDASRHRQTLIDLSMRYGLASSLTTFVAIEHRSLEERNDGRPELRRVPIQLASHWGGHDGFDLSRNSFSGMASPVLRSSNKRESPNIDDVKYSPATRDLEDDESISLVEILSLQQAAGFFEADISVDTTFESLGVKVPAAFVSSQSQATFKALLVLSRLFADDKQLWQRSARKAERWLAGDLNVTLGAVKQLLADAA